MRLYIVRHGKATDPVHGVAAPGAPTPGPGVDAVDFARTLTARGEAQARYLAAELGATDHRVRTVVASRFPRALSTAEAIAPALGAALVTDRRLEVDHAVGEALALIKEHENERALMLVAHNPQLGELVSVLCSGLGAGETLLRTGELVALDVRPSQPIGSGRIVQRLRLSEDAVTV